MGKPDCGYAVWQARGVRTGRVGDGAALVRRTEERRVRMTVGVYMLMVLEVRGVVDVFE